MGYEDCKHYRKQEAHGRHRSSEKAVSINNHIWAFYDYIPWGWIRQKKALSPLGN